jgi:hypothetical protein
VIVADCIKNGRNTLFGEGYAQSIICCWDLAAAHLCLEDALRNKPDEVGGDAFLVTGEAGAYTFGDTRKIFQVMLSPACLLLFWDSVLKVYIYGGEKTFAHGELGYYRVPHLLVFFLAHVVEALLFLRYYCLVPYYRLFLHRDPPPSPKIGETELFQPATLETYLMDVIVDDWRARKVFG